MPNYTVKRVGDEPKPWSNAHGQYLSYDVDLDNDGVLEMHVEWSRKTTSKAPEVGDRVAGTIQEGKYGRKFRMDFDATKELNQGSKSRTSSSSGRDLDASIARQVALKVLSAKICAHGLDAGIKAEVKNIETFILEAGQNLDRGTPEGVVPTPTPSPGPRSEQQSEHEWFEKLLETAAVNSSRAGHLRGFAFNKLTLTQRQESEKELEDIETQGAGVKRLVAAYEKTEGHPIPSPSDDDIPF